MTDTFIVSPVTPPVIDLTLVARSDTYARGSLILFGSAFTAADVLFSEGVFAPNASAVPEPTSIGLVGLGLAALATRRRKRKLH